MSGKTPNENFGRQAQPFLVLLVASIVMLGNLGGCSSNRFELANRDNGGSGRGAVPSSESTLVDPLQPPLAPTPGLAPDALGSRSAPPSSIAVIDGETREFAAAAMPPGDPGTRSRAPVSEREILGRVVDESGRPEPRASIQIADAAEPNRVVAEIASNTDGQFRLVDLDPNRVYELRAASTRGRPRFGAVSTRVPTSEVTIQLQVDGGSNVDSGGLQVGARETRFDVSTPQPTYARTDTAAFGTLSVSTPRLLEPTTSASPQAPISSTTPTSPVAFAKASLPAIETPRSAALTRPETLSSATPTGYSQAPLERLSISESTGTTITLSQIPGDYLLLDFFGSWCEPCRRAAPEVNRIAVTYASRGLTVLGIACESGDLLTATASAERTRQQWGLRYRVLVSPMDAASPLRSFYSVQAYPTLILVDRQGHVIARAVGGDARALRDLESAIASRLPQR